MNWKLNKFELLNGNSVKIRIKFKLRQCINIFTFFKRKMKNIFNYHLKKVINAQYGLKILFNRDFNN